MIQSVLNRFLHRISINVRMIIKFIFIFLHVYHLKLFLVCLLNHLIHTFYPLILFRSSIDLCGYMERRYSHLFRYSNCFSFSSTSIKQSICMFCKSMHSLHNLSIDFLFHSSVILLEVILRQYPCIWLRMIPAMIYIHDKCQQ